MPSDNGLTKSRSGGMSVSLSGPDGRVLGGGLAGMLVAAGPVQVWSHQSTTTCFTFVIVIVARMVNGLPCTVTSKIAFNLLL